MSPAIQHAVNLVANLGSVTPRHEQLIVVRVAMADGRNDGCGKCVLFERLSGDRREEVKPADRTIRLKNNNKCSGYCFSL